jgi:glucosamine--fructose-6-phosphate aminotransferase (isomerizing)
MCGIVGYIGKENAADILLDGLRRLEYRGYDSAGMVVLDGPRLGIRRSVGKLVNLEQHLKKHPLTGHAGVGHTRWATHGRPSEENAHPHRDASGRVVVVHNGIIENYMALKTGLQARGVKFESQTDTEVVAHLVGEAVTRRKGPDGVLTRSLFVDAVREGSIGNQRDLRSGHRVGGLSRCGDRSSTGMPLVGRRWRKRIFLGLRRAGHFGPHAGGHFSSGRGFGPVDAHRRIHREHRNRPAGGSQTHSPPVGPLQAEKAGYRHFMLKEIHEQPRSLEDTLRGRLNLDELKVHLDQLKLSEDQIRRFRKMTIVACGTSYHAGLMARYLLSRGFKRPAMWKSRPNTATEIPWRDRTIWWWRCLSRAKRPTPSPPSATPKKKAPARWPFAIRWGPPFIGNATEKF